MKTRSCSPPMHLPRRTDASRPLLALLGATLVIGGTFGATPCAASSAPAWMHAAASAPVPDHDDEVDAVLVYSETVMTVRGVAKFRRLDRRAYRILRPSGSRWGIVRIDFDDRTPIKDLHAWSIPAGGKDFQLKEGDAVETALFGVENGELMTDIRAKVLMIPAAVPGNIVGYEVEQEVRPYALGDDWEFQDEVPVGQSLYTLELPSGWNVKTTWINHAEVAPVVTNGQWHWSIGDVPAVKLEDRMPPWRGVAARMVVSFSPPGGEAETLNSWHSIGSWYTGLVGRRTDPTPDMRAKVAALTSAEPNTLAKIRALARFVQGDIRYVAIELGIGGHQPHPAAEVFTHRYGDCKDKVTLLATMLKEIGVESYYVMVNTVRGTITADTPANLDFNHAIIAIRLPPDLKDDASLLATVTHPKLGTLLIFDPTDELTPLGSLWGALQGSYALLVTPDGGELIPTPQLPAPTNGIARTATLALDANGSLHGDVREVHLGDLASRERGRLRAAAHDVDQIKPIEAFVSHSLATFDILKAQVANARAPDLPFEWRYSFDASNYAKVAGGLLLVRPRVLGVEADGFLETKKARRNAVEFDGPERDTDTFEITLPAGYEVDELPPPTNTDYRFASYHSKTELVGRVIRYTRTFEIKELNVALADTDDLKKFYRAISGDERRTAVLKPLAH